MNYSLIFDLNLGPSWHLRLKVRIINFNLKKDIVIKNTFGDQGCKKEKLSIFFDTVYLIYTREDIIKHCLEFSKEDAKFEFKNFWSLLYTDAYRSWSNSIFGWTTYCKFYSYDLHLHANLGKPIKYETMFACSYIIVFW